MFFQISCCWLEEFNCISAKAARILTKTEANFRISFASLWRHRREKACQYKTIRRHPDWVDLWPVYSPGRSARSHSPGCWSPASSSSPCRWPGRLASLEPWSFQSSPRRSCVPSADLSRAWPQSGALQSSQIQMEDHGVADARPALLCHKDTAQGKCPFTSLWHNRSFLYMEASYHAITTHRKVQNAPSRGQYLEVCC